MNIWLSTKEVAKLLSVCDRTIQKSKNNYEYRYVKGIGYAGKNIQILLTSLPQQAQDKYNETHNQQENEINETENKKDYSALDVCTSAQRADIAKKQFIVQSYWKSQKSPAEFVEDYNRENPDDTITASQLFRWQNKLKSGGPIALLDGRGGHNRGQSKVTDEMWDVFMSYYLDQNKPSIQLCYKLTSLYLKMLLPSISAFKTRLSKVPLDVIQYHREGKDAFITKQPYMIRNYNDIDSNDVWFSDHHIFDVFVNDMVGKPTRYWLTIWFDARSRKVMGYVVRPQKPNSIAIKKALCLAMQTYGVPLEVYIDNGKDYKSKDLFDLDYPSSVANQLGINSIFATPYHGQAKSVERFFNTLEEQFGKLFPTYAGSNAKKRPERMQISNDAIALIAPSEDKFLKAFEGFVNMYNDTIHRGQGMDGRCPNQVYYEELKNKRVVKDPDLLTLLCGISEVRKVNRNMIYIRGRNYYNDALCGYDGKKVRVTFDVDNLEIAFVFDLDGRALCKAKPAVLTMFRHATEEDYREAQRRVKLQKEQIKQYKPEKENLPTFELIAEIQSEEHVYAEQCKAITETVQNEFTEQAHKAINLPQQSHTILKPDNSANSSAPNLPDEKEARQAELDKIRDMMTKALSFNQKAN